MSDLSGHPSEEIPSTIGRYKIQARVSSDAKDDVYAAFDPMIERPVAIKVFRVQVADAAAAASIKQTFYREMQRVGALIHPNIVTLYDAGELPGALFTVSEFVEGTSLAERLEASATLDLPMRVSMLVQMIDALEYARGLGTPHLSLKPGAVYIAGDGTLKVSGFGVAPVLDAIARETSHPPLTTSRYVAPERTIGQTGDARADVYSLAELALDILAGPRDVTAADAESAIPPLPDYLAERRVDPDRWRAVFRRALAVDAAHRYDSVLTFKFELILLLGVDERDAHLSWETARALGQLSAITGDTTGRSDDAATTMLADSRRTMLRPATRAWTPPAEEADTGQMETALSHAASEATTTAIQTPKPWEKDVAGSDEETRPPHSRPDKDRL